MTLTEAKQKIDELIALHGGDRECILSMRPTDEEITAAAAQCAHFGVPVCSVPVRVGILTDVCIR